MPNATMRRLSAAAATTALFGALALTSATNAGAVPTTQTFTTAGTASFTVPACVTSIMVEAVGGAGGAGGSSTPSAGGPGGGGSVGSCRP